MLASEISRSLELDELIRAHGSESLLAFAQALQESSETTIEAFLHQAPAKDNSELGAMIAVEMRHRLSLGLPCRIEDYLRRFPDLSGDYDQVLDLIYAEYCERRQRDVDTQPHEYYERFPDFHQSLERLFQLDSLIQTNVFSDSASLPESGDSFLEFDLKRELGRGGCGRVFLAEQQTLSNRQVVLKITPRQTIEHRTLARLNHPNIVPILSVHHDELSGLHAVCMPFRAAVSLSDVRPAWDSDRTVPQHAAQYLHAVAASIAPNLSPQAEEQETSDFPANRPFIHACAWIMQKIAEALHHAHMRQICHRDLKPSNILLTVSGNPLLVDFNLSFNEVESGTDYRAFFGGTLPYIPPEQIQALHPIEQGRVEDVGVRADIYSLAATMFEVMTGRLPFELPPPGTDLLTAIQSQLDKRYAAIPLARSVNPDVPADLSLVLAKCMDPAPERRYETAAQLAEDLDRFLRDRPMAYIGPVRTGDRIKKFLRRNRRKLSTTAGVVLVAVSAMAYLHRERQARGRAEVQVNQLQITAEKEADAALAGLPKDAYKYFLVGHEYFIARQFGHAIRCLTRSLELRSDYAPSYYYRGRCFSNLDRDAEALADYSMAIKLDPDDVYAPVMRAIFYSTSESYWDLTKAIDDVATVLKLLPYRDDESARVLHLDVTRIYSALSTKTLAPTERERFLQLAEIHFAKAIELGMGVEYFNGIAKSDRFRMLDPLLARPIVLDFLEANSKQKAGFTAE